MDHTMAVGEHTMNVCPYCLSEYSSASAALADIEACEAEDARQRQWVAHHPTGRVRNETHEG